MVPPKKRHNLVNSSSTKKTTVFHESVDDSVPLLGIVHENVKQKVGKGIVIKEPSEVLKSDDKVIVGIGLGFPACCEKELLIDAALDKGKGKLIIASLTVEISSDDEDSRRLSSVLPPSMDVSKQLVQGDGDMGHGPFSCSCSPPPPLKYFTLLISFLNHTMMICCVMMSLLELSLPIVVMRGLVVVLFFLDLPINEDDEVKTLTENSFQSLHYDNFIVHQIELLGVEQCSPMEHTSQSESSKRKVEEHEGESASSSLKRPIN